MTTTIKKIMETSNQRLKKVGIPSYSLDSRLLLAYALDETPEYIVGYPERKLNSKQAAITEALIERREQREPISHIIGKREFWGMEFLVTPDTLDPRPDSETLIEAVLKHHTNKDACLRILDFGTGTGCLLLSLLKEYPNAKGIGVDISYPALEVAQENAENHELSERVRFQLSDWGAGVEGSYDLIISNPPYIPENDIEGLEPEVSLFEPKMALSGGEDGLRAYRIIIPWITYLLKPMGKAVFECGVGQVKPITELLATAGMGVEEVFKDLAGQERSLVVSFQ